MSFIAWELENISISVAEYWTSFWYWGLEELGNGVLLNSLVIVALQGNAHKRWHQAPTQTPRPNFTGTETRYSSRCPTKKETQAVDLTFEIHADRRMWSLRDAAAYYVFGV